MFKSIFALIYGLFPPGFDQKPEKQLKNDYGNNR